MTISFASPARSVLLIGDDAVHVYGVSTRQARLLDTVPWQVEDFVERLTGLLKKEGGGKPALVLNDMTDQYFKGGQRLPNVGVLDKSGVLKRKLQVAFPSYPIRGALMMKTRKGAPKLAVANEAGTNIRLGKDMYLFAGVPMSESLTMVFEAVRLSMVSVAGFSLLPVESADMVGKLGGRVAGKDRDVAEWAIFIGQHQSGALRQVITRNGQLAMTRITSVSDKNKDYKAWAQDVLQEFKATLSYLSRYGYSQEDGTELMVVCSPEAGDALGQILDVPCHYTSFTVNEAARILGLTIGVQDDPHYADALHAAWAGRKSAFTMPMLAPDLDRIAMPRRYVAVGAVALVLAMGYLGWESFNGLSSMLTTKSELAEKKAEMTQAEAAYQEELTRMKALGFDVQLIQASIRTYEKLQAEKIDALPFLTAIGKALGDELRLDKLTVKDVTAENKAPLDPYAPVPEAPPGGKLEASLVLSFPPTIEPEEGIRQINNLERRLVSLFPNYEVRILKQVADPVYTKATSGEVGATANRTKEALDLTAELSLKGPVR